MSTLYIQEFATLANDSSAGGGVLLPKCPSLSAQTVAIGAGSAQSSAFSKDTRFIELSSDVVCSVNIGGSAPVATAASPRIPANAPPRYYAVNPGDKLAVIQNT